MAVGLFLMGCPATPVDDQYKSARDQSEEDDTGNQFQEKRPQKRSQKIGLATSWTSLGTLTLQTIIAEGIVPIETEGSSNELT